MLSSSAPPEQSSTRTGSRAWILHRLDALLSEPLRRSPPSEFVRYRILVGAACFLFLFNTVFSVWVLLLDLPAYPSIIAGLLYLGTLLLVRRSSTPGPPTVLLLSTMILVVLGVSLDFRFPYVGMHAVPTLIPALAVFLAGTRVGLLVTLLLISTLSLGYPFYLSRVGIAPEALSQKLPAYLIALSRQLHEEREGLLQEMHALRESVEHINSIIAMQQMHARAAGVVEQVAVPQLIDEALRLLAGSFGQLGIRIERDYVPVPPLSVDRHKLLQILINLLSNARHALVDSQKEDKWMRLRIRPTPDGTGTCIEVTDNGVGIAPELLPRLFMQGFTTKKKGHGFGLHISALSAAELKGKLTCSSPGIGQGATFTLELPTEAKERSG